MLNQEQNKKKHARYAQGLHWPEENTLLHIGRQRLTGALRFERGIKVDVTGDTNHTFTHF